MISSISDAGIYVSELVNHQAVSIMLDTISTVSEETWVKCAENSRFFKLVKCTVMLMQCLKNQGVSLECAHLVV